MAKEDQIHSQLIREKREKERGMFASHMINNLRLSEEDNLVPKNEIWKQNISQLIPKVAGA